MWQRSLSAWYNFRILAKRDWFTEGILELLPHRMKGLIVSKGVKGVGGTQKARVKGVQHLWTVVGVEERQRH